MFTGLTVAACLLLTGDPAPAPDYMPVSSLRFEIPFTVIPSERPDIQALHVYVSKDLGKNWQMLPEIPMPADDRVAPKAIYQAREDGMYYFTVHTVSKTNHMENPPRPVEGTVGQKILVKTRPSPINLKAERIGEKIQATWTIDDDYVNRATFRLEYQDPIRNEWILVPEAPVKRESSYAFPAPPSAPINVRLTIRDVVDHLGKAEAFVAAAVNTNWPPDSSPNPNIKPIPPVTNDNPPTPIPPSGTQLVNTTPLVTDQKPVAYSNSTNSTPQYPPASSGYPALAQVKMVPQPQVKIEFGVDHLGPSGVGKVDIYLTTDDGLHWVHTATETPLRGKNEYGQPSGAVSVMVTIPKQETVHGIFLVVKNGAGVGGPPPRDGQDRPMMRVEVDTRGPEVWLYAPRPDPVREGVLILSWKAVDRNLDDYPITLEFREDPNMPWRLVSSTPTLPNTGANEPHCTGSYAWTVPSISQGRVFLKLTVRDRAGNVSEATTAEAVLIDMSKPSPVDIRILNGN